MTIDSEVIYKHSYYIDGMNLEENYYKPIKMRMDNILGDCVIKKVGNKIHNTYNHGIKLIHNDTSSVSKFNHGDGSDITLIWGYNQKEFEAKNLKWYKKPQSLDWGEKHIFPRFSDNATDRTVIATYRDGNFAGTLKKECIKREINIIYVGHKVLSQYDGKIRNIVHKKITPDIKRIESYSKIQDKKKEFKDKRRRGVKQDNSNTSIPNNNDLVIRYLAPHTDIQHTNINIEDNIPIYDRMKLIKLKNWAELSGETQIEEVKPRKIYKSWLEFENAEQNRS